MLRDCFRQKRGSRIRIPAQCLRLQIAECLQHPFGRRIWILIGIEFDQIPNLRLLARRVRDHSSYENTCIVALTSNSIEERVIRQYDGCINIYDPSARIIQKLQSAIEEAQQNPKGEHNELSSRERDILVAVAKGKTNKEIADEFNLSVYTVISHRRNISRKLGINSIPGLTVYAIMNKLVDMSDFN